MNIFIKHIGRILIVALGLSILISAGSLWALRHSSFYKPSFVTHEVKEKEFDYIIIGASTGLTTLNTKVIDSLNHTRGINLSMVDTALSSQYLMLQHFLAEGKSTKFCVLAPSAQSFDRKKNNLSDNDYRFLMFANRQYVSNYYESYTGKEASLLYNSKWIPLLGVSYYNVELFYPSLISLIKPEMRNRFDNKGNYTYPEISKRIKPIESFTKIPLDFTNIYVNKIKALCELHNIKLICYLSPIEGKKVVTQASKYTIINHSDLLTNTKYFYDAIHVNQLGRKITSLRFAKELVNYIE